LLGGTHDDESREKVAAVSPTTAMLQDLAAVTMVKRGLTRPKPTQRVAPAMANIGATIRRLIQ